MPVYACSETYLLLGTFGNMREHGDTIRACVTRAKSGDVALALDVLALLVPQADRPTMRARVSALWNLPGSAS